MSETPTPEEISAAMSVLSRIPSERKRQARQANARKAGEANKRPSPCTCGRDDVTDPLKHKSTCRVYQAEKQRIRRAKTKEGQAEE